MLLVAVIVSPLAPADAAFTDSTRNSGSAWTVSSTLSRTIVVDTLPPTVRGTVPVTATLNEPSGRAFAVRIEYAPAGTTAWRTLCTDNTAPYDCSWSTTGTTGGAYDVRAVATSGTTTYISAAIRTIVDNTAPATTMLDPGSPLKGTVTTTATASDAHSGVAKVVIQYAPAGSTTFKDICTDTTAPYSCSFDTTTTADGTYTFRSVTTDAAGWSTTSATVIGRIVDNSYATVTMDDPGAYLAAGSVVLKANAAASAGVTSVRIQSAPSGTTTWSDVCTDTTSPYTCTVNTLDASDGLYDVRAIMLDRSGKSTTPPS